MFLGCFNYFYVKRFFMVITIGSQKGGAGKSTVAINMALMIASSSQEYQVALVDTDKQRSCIQTLGNNERENLNLYEVQSKPNRLIQELDEHVVIVDTPPHSHEVMHLAAAVSDVVIIPVQPSPLDIRAAKETVKALEVIIEEANRDLKCRFLLNRIKAGTILAKEIRQTVQRLYPFLILETALHDRQVYKQSLITGESVLEFDKNSAASKEMAELVIEVLRL